MLTMNKLIIVSSDECPPEYLQTNGVNGKIMNIVPGPPLILSPRSQIALLDITLPLMEDYSDPARNENVVIFPADQSKNTSLIFPSTTSIDEINNRLFVTMAQKCPGQSPSKDNKFEMHDVTDPENKFHDEASALGSSNQMWYEWKGDADNERMYQAPYLCDDRHQNTIYQVPGYHTGNIPVFLQLSEAFRNNHKYGGLLFSPDENSERLRHFTKWRFCKKELGTSFPMQPISKPLVQIKLTDPTSKDAVVFKIPPVSSQEEYDGNIVRKTKQIDITCNLLEKNSKVLETLIVSPSTHIGNMFGTFQRFNARFQSPKYHRVSGSHVSEIILNIKDHATGKCIKLPVGSVIATLMITDCR